MYTVYWHKFPNGKIYIGITERPIEKRFGKNGANYQRCPAVYRAIQKYGWENIEHRPLVVCKTKEEAEKIERFMISSFNTTNNKYGYNIMPGGDARGKLPEESKKRIGEKNKASWANDEKKRVAAAERMKKRMADPQYRQKVLDALRNAKREKHCGGGCEHFKKRVAQISLSGEIVKIWDCMADVQRAGVATRQAISLCCLGKIKTCKGFIWKFADDV